MTSRRSTIRPAKDSQRMLKVGYKASAEQFAPAELVELAL